jgi:signal transduction histidine kinase
VKNLSRLAQTSAEQGTALILERDERRRAEADSQFKQTLLGQARDEKVQLGRDLHDGIIQSLYAAGLTLESARELVHRDPAEAGRRLASTLAALNTVIRDVRDYIHGLAPERLQRASFGRALQVLTEGLGAGREAKFDIQIDDEAAGLLDAGQITDALQIAHEAISNGLRHGRATIITLRLRRGEREVCLLVQDNGAGFDPAARDPAGHGVNNMQARATRLGAELRVTSSPGTGTRVVVNIPILLEHPTSNIQRPRPKA